MSIFKEGFYCSNLIVNASIRIFNDAADYGAPCKKGDQLWNAAKQLIEWYGGGGEENQNRKESRYSTGASVQAEFTLIDEGAISDGRKTFAKATKHYRLYYVTCTTGACKGFDGYLTIEKLN